jgi:hypothetical protein
MADIHRCPKAARHYARCGPSRVPPIWGVSAVSDEMRELIESEWPELMYMLPPRTPEASLTQLCYKSHTPFESAAFG